MFALHLVHGMHPEMFEAKVINLINLSSIQEKLLIQVALMFPSP